MGTVYALINPYTGVCRYIGLTVREPEVRFKQHLSTSFSEKCKPKFNTHKSRWIRSVVNRGKEPVLHILTQLPGEEWLDECEIYWINYFNSIGCDLTNTATGGRGGDLGVKARRPRKTHCKRGHEFTEPNTYYRPNGTGRQCKECTVARGQDKYKTRGQGTFQRSKTHCPQGHEYSQENTYFTKTKQGWNSRSCKTCKRDRRKSKQK